MDNGVTSSKRIAVDAAGTRPSAVAAKKRPVSNTTALPEKGAVPLAIPLTAHIGTSGFEPETTTPSAVIDSVMVGMMSLGADINAELRSYNTRADISWSPAIYYRERGVTVWKAFASYLQEIQLYAGTQALSMKYF